MKTKKAFIRLNGEIGEKEIPGIEYIDENYGKRVHKHQQEIDRILSKTPQKDSNDTKSKS